ncbi:hypothetical protein RKD55_004558 [Rossellomorea marisflavi]
MRILTIEEHAVERLNNIQLESLSDVKDILESKYGTSDEKIHLIKSRFIIEKHETKDLEQEIKEFKGMEATINEQMEQVEAYCADCDGSCENDAPDGQLTIFDFIDAANADAQSSSKDESKELDAGDLPEEVFAIIKGIAGALEALSK